MSDTALEVQFRLRRLRWRWMDDRTSPVLRRTGLRALPDSCKGMGVRFKRIYPDVDWEDMREFTDDDHDPFGLADTNHV